MIGYKFYSQDGCYSIEVFNNADNNIALDIKNEEDLQDYTMPVIDITKDEAKTLIEVLTDFVGEK